MATAGTASADTPPTTLVVRPAGGVTEGVCLDIVGGSYANAAPVQIYACNGTPTQKFIKVTAGSTIRSAATGKCLNVIGGATANGSKVDMYTCNGTGAQVWLDRGTVGQPRSLYNPQSNKCLNDPKGSLSGARIEIWDCTGSNNQLWQQSTSH
ncbi:ricin-type beta-trefoil lectin domain protein [Streptomyces sp. NPDC057908]|uniref:ricin-type beta-trefoil lectin domain protein n=1 Tax=Streptomyces sp. NPDC057908 TaxID=3346276 RepID=UPI0036E97DF1